MDASDLTLSIEELRRRYLDVRALRTELTEVAPGAAVPDWLAESCRRVVPSGPGDRDGLSEAMRAEAESLAERLGEARQAHWEQQLRMLRYSLVLLENRVDALRAGLELEDDIAASMGSGDLLGRLETQMATLRETIARWEQSRVVSEPCSLAQIAAFIADPHHEGDKEHLERILERGAAAALHPEDACIDLVWDTVSGRIDSARLIAKDSDRAA